MPHQPPVRERDVLDVAARVRGLDDAEDAGAVAARGGEVGLDRLAPEPGVDGQRVGARLVALEVGGGIGARGRADVAALAVGDHEQARPAARRRRPPRRRPSLGAERLEERELRLDRDRMRRDRVDDPAAEAGDVPAQLDREQIGQRVEPDDELAALALDLGREPVGERERGDGHRASSLVAGPEAGNERGPHDRGPR